MPIYEYKCKNCGHEYELIQKMSDSPVTECEVCHKNTAVRLVSAAGFQLKGTGWYATDFKDKGKPAAAKSTDAKQVTTDTKNTESKASTKDGE